MHCAALMDIGHLKHAELGPKDQKYNGRVVLRGDTEKDDSGACAVVTEQGSSASQMTAAKVMNVVARPQGCAGQAADALSANTQEKWRTPPRLLKIPKSECPDFCIRLPRHKWPKSGRNIEYSVVPVDEICTVTHLQASCENDKLGTFYWDWDGNKDQIENVYLFTENKDCSDRFTWMTFKKAGRQQKMDHMWKQLMELVDLDEPTSFLDHACFWKVLNGNANRTRDCS